MKTARYTLGAFLSIGAFSAYGESVIKTFKADQIKNLKLNNGSGDVIIEGKNSSEAKVEAKKIKWNEKCELEINQVGDVIDVAVTQKSSASSFFSSNDCQVNFQIVLPSRVNLTTTSGSGNLDIFGVIGNMGVVLGSGDLKMEKIESESLQAQSGSGDLKIDGIINTADIKVGSGDVDLTYRKIPTTGSVTIKSGSGNATLRMPVESRIKVDFKAGSGKLTSELDQLQAAPYSISMSAGSGDLRIKKL